MLQNKKELDLIVAQYKCSYINMLQDEKVLLSDPNNSNKTVLISADKKRERMQ